MQEIVELLEKTAKEVQESAKVIKNSLSNSAWDFEENSCIEIFSILLLVHGKDGRSYKERN